MTRGQKLRTDGTVVESNIRPPSDNRLLADSVRVLARNVVRARAVLSAAGKKAQKKFEDFTQEAKQLSRQIGETLRTKTDSGAHCWAAAIPGITRDDPRNGGRGAPN